MFSKIELWPMKNSNSKIKARGRVTVADVMNVNVTVMEGQNGLFVGLPGRWGEKDGNRKWFSDVFIPDKKVLEDLNKQVIDAYKTKVGMDNLDQGEAPGPTNQSGNSFPF